MPLFKKGGAKSARPQDLSRAEDEFLVGTLHFHALTVPLVPYSVPSQESLMDRQRFLLPALALITVWRMALLPTVELSPDEALAALYGHHPHAWFLEMGPLVPWLVRLTTWLLGAGEFGVRFLAPLCAFAVTVCLWRLVRGLFDATTAAWAVVLLQVVPGFNLAAVTMTSAIVGLAALMGLVLALRIALHRPSAWHPAWWVAALCLLLAILADWRNGLAYLCCALALGLPRKRRHHLLSPGFGVITVAFVIGLIWFLRWNISADWPIWEAGHANPLWTVLPNLLRWMLLCSPLLLTLIVWALERTWRFESTAPDVFFVVAFAAPFAALDFGWGPLERWPHTGFQLWSVLSVGLLAHHSLRSLQLPTRGKVLLRTVTTVTAALMTMIIVRTDMLRHMGLPWPMQQHLEARRTWRSFFTKDPSSDMLGWREGTKIVESLLTASKAKGGAEWFVMARDWRIAAPTEFYLPTQTPVFQPTPEFPKVHPIQQVERNNPMALWPRYDSTRNGTESDFRGRNAFYVTDDAAPSSPPPAVRHSFASFQLVSVANVMHGGHRVRTLKVFACYAYRPPEL